LDSNLNEVVLNNPNKISSKEKRKIYNYVEYYINEDDMIDNLTYYYAKGKYPEHTSSSGQTKIIEKKYSSISFSRPEDRGGTLRSKTLITPTSPPSNTFINNLYDTYKITKYWPNGNLMHSTEFDLSSKDGNGNPIPVDGIWKRYDPDGIVEFVRTFENLKLVNAIQYYKNLEDASYAEYKFEDGIVASSIVYNSAGIITRKNYFDNNGNYDENKTELYSVNGNLIYNYSILGWNESTLKNYYDNKENRGLIEGLFTVKHPDGERNYKIAVLEAYDGSFIGNQIEWFSYNYDAWEKGEGRAKFEETAVDGFYDITWYDDYKKQEVSDIVEAKAGGSIMSFGNYNMIRLYPKINSNSSNNTKISLSPHEWKGNGSGIILTKDGYIATNNHVIEDATDIEVEFKNEGEIKSYKAEVIRTDPINDLAIIKINDESFNNLKSILYNFKTRRSEIGESVFALGYPKAFSMMGTDIKFTDGKISSLTGAMGDVTNYQTSTPIQPGNSGGPLFDMNGNLIAINASKIVKEDIENVSYSIKTIYLLTLIDALPKTIQLPYSRYLDGKPLTEQIKILQRYVTLIKVR